MTISFRFAHLSDLHFSSGISQTLTHSHSIKLLKDAQKILERQSFDKIIFSGDISDRGDDESLLRAKSWIHDDTFISSKEKIGLKLSESDSYIVPGNHDAYNASEFRGGYSDFFQKSLGHFFKVFKTSQSEKGCRYDWIEKDGRGIYFLLLDSCYLSDSESDNHASVINMAMRGLGAAARGRLIDTQISQISKWFSLGLAGKLPYPGDNRRFIPSDLFAKSFKIVIMHHYLFEPKDCKENFWHSVEDRDKIFKTLAFADMDMLLCGHKHIPEFKKYTYGEKCDPRARRRYCYELFLRALGIHEMPKHYVDRKKGKFYTKNFSILTNLFSKMINSRSSRPLNEEDFTSQLIDLLCSCLKEPAIAGKELHEFMSRCDASDLKALDDDLVSAIERVLSERFGKAERDQLALLAKNYLQKAIKNIHRRPFIQSIAGSSAKDSLDPQAPRSVHTYEIELSDNKTIVNHTKYVLSLEKEDFVVGKPENAEFKNDLSGLFRVVID